MSVDYFTWREAEVEKMRIREKLRECRAMIWHGAVKAYLMTGDAATLKIPDIVDRLMAQYDVPRHGDAVLVQYERIVNRWNRWTWNYMRGSE